MKKTIFTFCSITAVCCAIFFACAKDDNSITHVGYVSQTSGGTTSGTGGNPNPNGLPSNSGYGTTTATTNATTTSTTHTNTTNYAIDGTASSSITTSTIVVAGSYIVSAKDASNNTIQIAFPGTSAPASSQYTIVSGAPAASQCGFTFTNSSGTVFTASNGTVTVTAATSPNNSAAFVSISCVNGGVTHTVSGTVYY